MKEKRIRDSIVDGIFYPQEKQELLKVIKGYFEEVNTDDEEAAGIISPHAGYQYSGIHSAKAFAAATGRKISTVVCLGPVHRDPENGIFLSESDYFHTPLGDIAVDQVLCQELFESSTHIIQHDIPHLEEHCLETQLPFVQYFFPKAKIVPILIGIQSPKTIISLANALDFVFTDKLDETLFLVSANASTYGKKEDSQRNADLLIELIEEGNPDKLIPAMTEKKLNSCGTGCIAAVLLAPSFNLSCRLLSHGSSSDVQENSANTVHYAAFQMIRNRSNE